VHQFDPNGQLREYRYHRDRRDCYLAILFGVGAVCALAFIVAGVFVTLSLLGH
jgi:hypothetical protein